MFIVKITRESIEQIEEANILPTMESTRTDKR